MADLDYAAFDCDNHYYEALDAFTRHLDPRLGPRTIEWAEIEGRRHYVVAGRVARVVANPTFDPIARPGALHDYFRGNPEGRSPLDYLREREPIRPEYRDRDARVRVLDEQGLQGCWLFPTLGVLFEELLKRDVEAVTHSFQAFNRWIDEDWGLARDERIFAAPYVALGDVDWAVRELEWALSRGARVVVMRPAAVWTASGPRSPADPHFDPFWARINEAGITVVVHAGDSGYTNHGYSGDGFGATFGGDFARPSLKVWHIERAACDFLATVIFDKLFERFPNLRMASVENGSEFLPDLFRKLRASASRMPGYYREDPVETLKRHVWMNPFWEDDAAEVVELMGADRVIFGSDWPHIEGMPQPLDYAAEVAGLSPEVQRRVLRENGRELTELRPS